jgi:hypothetical protein
MSFQMEISDFKGFLKARLSPSLLWEYVVAFKNTFWEIFWGAGVLGIIFGIYTLYRSPSLPWLLCYLLAVSFMTGYLLWRTDHVRLEPRVSIVQVVQDEWMVGGVPEAQHQAILWYFSVKNASDGSTVTGINVQLNRIEPPVYNLDWLPVHLHIKHDNPARAENHLLAFDLNPGGCKNVDFVSAFVGDGHFEIRHILPAHINHGVRNGRYRVQVMVTANNLAPLFRWFEVWTDDNRVLQCRMV